MVKIIYCRGGDKSAPIIAKEANMLYGVRYDYTAYAKIYMLDGGLNPKWSHYIKRAKKLRPEFALVPDYEFPDQKKTMELQVIDLEMLNIPKIGVCPKFTGAVFQLPQNVVICESIPSQYAGWLIPDSEILKSREYHLLGGDPVLQKSEINRISNFGGRVVSVDGNKIAMKGAHGQIFCGGKWIKNSAPTLENIQISAFEVVKFLTA